MRYKGYLSVVFRLALFLSSALGIRLGNMRQELSCFRVLMQASGLLPHLLCMGSAWLRRGMEKKKLLGGPSPMYVSDSTRGYNARTPLMSPKFLGGLTTIVGILCLFLLGTPSEVTWLTPKEKEMVSTLIL